MDLSALIRMSKQISLNMPGSKNRPEKLALHFKQFWTPKMLNEFTTYLEKNEEEFPEEITLAFQILQKS